MKSSEEGAKHQDPLPSDFDQLTLSKWGLDWGDISLIRSKLELTPTERVRSAQSCVDSAFKLRNARRA